MLRSSSRRETWSRKYYYSEMRHDDLARPAVAPDVGGRSGSPGPLGRGTARGARPPSMRQGSNAGMDFSLVRCAGLRTVRSSAPLFLRR